MSQATQESMPDEPKKMKHSDREPMSLYLPELLFKRLDDYARKHFRPRATVVYEAIDNFLKTREGR